MTDPLIEGTRVEVVWMGQPVQATIFKVGRNGFYRVVIEGVDGKPWYRESEIVRV